MKASIKAIEYILPDIVLSNEQLAMEFASWTAEKIESKTGIRERRVARSGECASDLADRAALKLFASEICRREEVDYLLLCTQSPDYFLPTTACLLQHRLSLPVSCGALDFNLGCSGFVYGLGLAKGLIETGQARKVLLITAETYSKHIHHSDKSVRTVFGDAAAATLVSGVESTEALIDGLVFGTDGSGGKNLIVPTGGMRNHVEPNAPIVADESGNSRTVNNLYMNGPEIFNFTLRVVPSTVAEVLRKSGKSLGEIDLFVFHQANRFMLEHLQRKLKLPPERFVISMADCGNTVSSTIPIALKEAELEGRLHRGNLLMLVGFGVGYSWAGAIVRW